MQIQQIVDTTVDPKFIKAIITQDTMRKKLKTLAETVRPSNESMREELLTRYELLKSTPYGKDVQKYFDDWQSLKIDDQSQLMAAKIFPQGDYDPCRALILAMQPLYPTRAEMQGEVLTKSGNNSSLLAEIEGWRNKLRFERLEKFPKGKAIKNATASASGATLQGVGKTSNTKSPMESNVQGATKEFPPCLFGLKHHWAECYYLNESYPRPDTWKPDKKVKAEINKRLKDTKLKERIDKTVNRWKNKNKSNDADDSEPKSFAAQEGEEEEDDDPMSFASTYTGSLNDKQHLRASVIYDTGSNVHVVNRHMEHRIVNRRSAEPGQGLIAGGHFYEAKEIVDAVVYPAVEARKVVINLTDALFIPEFMTSVAASGNLMKKGLHFDTTDPDWMFTMAGGKRVRVCKFDGTCRGHRVLERFPMGEEGDTIPIAMVAKERGPLMLTSKEWHEIMGHPSAQAIKDLEQNTEGCIITDYKKGGSNLIGQPPKMMDCNTCIKSKAHALVSRTSETHREVARDKEMGHMAVVSWDLIEMELSLKMKQETSYRYISHFYYDNEGYHVADPLSVKSEIGSLIKTTLLLAKATLGAETIMFRSDNDALFKHKGTENVSDNLKQLGIKHLISATYTPAQNGAAEVAGKTIMTKCRSILEDSKLPNYLWPWIVKAAVYLLNRTPTKKLEGKTPYEAVTGKRPYLGHLHPLGCKSFALNNSTNIERTKLDPRAHLGFHLGCADSTNIFYVWIPHQNRVIRIRDVYFKDAERYDPLDIDNRALKEVIPASDHQLIVQRMELPEEISLHSLKPSKSKETHQKVSVVKPSGSGERTKRYRERMMENPDTAEHYIMREREKTQRYREKKRQATYPTPSLTTNQDDQSTENPEEGDQTYAVHLLDTLSKEVSNV